jgi:uncharacterized membrane protein
MGIYNPIKYKEWYYKNKEKKRNYARKYYELHREEKIRYAKEFRIKNPTAWRISHRKRIYGVTNEDVNKMVLEQENKCAICSVYFHPKEKNRKMSIDHCHIKNKVRGLLCNKCNISLGHLEKEGFLINALKYLKKYE